MSRPSASEQHLEQSGGVVDCVVTVEVGVVVVTDVVSVVVVVADVVVTGVVLVGVLVEVAAVLVAVVSSSSAVVVPVGVVWVVVVGEVALSSVVGVVGTSLHGSAASAFEVVPPSRHVLVVELHPQRPSQSRGHRIRRHTSTVVGVVVVGVVHTAQHVE